MLLTCILLRLAKSALRHQCATLTSHSLNILRQTEISLSRMGRDVGMPSQSRRQLTSCVGMQV